MEMFVGILTDMLEPRHCIETQEATTEVPNEGEGGSSI
jgi:hypothetical protein